MCGLRLLAVLKFCLLLLSSFQILSFSLRFNTHFLLDLARSKVDNTLKSVISLDFNPKEITSISQIRSGESYTRMRVLSVGEKQFVFKPYKTEILAQQVILAHTLARTMGITVANMRLLTKEEIGVVLIQDKQFFKEKKTKLLETETQGYDTAVIMEKLTGQGLFTILGDRKKESKDASIYFPLNLNQAKQLAQIFLFDLLIDNDDRFSLGQVDKALNKENLFILDNQALAAIDNEFPLEHKQKNHLNEIQSRANLFSRFLSNYARINGAEEKKNCWECLRDRFYGNTAYQALSAVLTDFNQLSADIEDIVQNYPKETKTIPEMLERISKRTTFLKSLKR